ncbi:MAG: response regulator [Myxococcota bacterium]|nr:response regulator [Myxococcota bacterium]
MNSEESSKDRRQSPRVGAEFRVKYSTLDQLVLAFTKNISQGGLFIATETLLPVNAVVNLVISLPNEGGDISCIARVVRAMGPDDGDPNRKHGLALEFLDVSWESIEQIEAYISQTVAREAEASMLPRFDCKLSVLVVDDDKTYRENAVRILAEQGHEVTWAEDGLKGLAACLRKPPDLVLSDVNMPLMDGWNFLRTIRARPSLSSTIVIFQTTLNSEKERLKGYQLGVDDYLAKPYSAEELLLRIERLFQRSAARSQNTSKKALRGDIEQVSLPTVLSMLELEQKTGVVVVVGPRLCRLYVREGRPMNIEMDGVTGKSPLNLVVELFRWTKGQFEFAPQDIHSADELQISMQGLLMEAARLTDEENR